MQEILPRKMLLCPSSSPGLCFKAPGSSRGTGTVYGKHGQSLGFLLAPRARADICLRFHLLIMDFHVGTELLWWVREAAGQTLGQLCPYPLLRADLHLCQALTCGANAKSGTVPASHIPSPSPFCFPKPVSPRGGASSSPRQRALSKHVACAHQSALLLLRLLLTSPFGKPGKQKNIETRQQHQRLPALMVGDLATAAQTSFCFLVDENISGCFNVCSFKWLPVPGGTGDVPCPMFSSGCCGTNPLWWARGRAALGHLRPMFPPIL